ncbi:unnamed protein product, partial [Didymodactylos carnosus]
SFYDAEGDELVEAAHGRRKVDGIYGCATEYGCRDGHCWAECVNSKE